MLSKEWGNEFPYTYLEVHSQIGGGSFLTKHQPVVETLILIHLDLTKSLDPQAGVDMRGAYHRTGRNWFLRTQWNKRPLNCSFWMLVHCYVYKVFIYRYDDMIYVNIGWDGLLRQDTSQHQNYIVRDLYHCNNNIYFVLLLEACFKLKMLPLFDCLIVSIVGDCQSQVLWKAMMNHYLRIHLLDGVISWL